MAGQVLRRDAAGLEDGLGAARQWALGIRHRCTLLLSGDPHWTADLAHRVVAAWPAAEPCWLTDRGLVAHALPLRAATSLLGRDLDLLIYDAHGGFDPDGFGAATGAIRGGGLLVLLTPPLADWPRQADPQAARIVVWPHRTEELSGRFIQRLAHVLRTDHSLLTLVQEDSGPASRHPVILHIPPELSNQGPITAHQCSAHGLHAPVREVSVQSPPRLSQPVTPDQRRALAAILLTARGRARRPLVLTAHRGRGKSAVLGLAAGHLLATRRGRILVTAPRHAAVTPLFRHAAAVLHDLEDADTHARQRMDDLVFLSPDVVATTRPPADLLLIDEAAGIPAPLLAILLAHYPRLVFATTVHGYEGTGRGFEVRFRTVLEHLTPQWRALTLDTPIRWASGDPLEALTFRALLLDAAPAPDETIGDAWPADCQCERLSRVELAGDEATLREVFGLLVLAHYQTRPMDLRMLLDGPNVRVYGLRHRGRIAATLFAAAEGGFDEADLREAIFTGRRRPRGHLLPQTLSAHAGLWEAPALSYLRVIRIAVHPRLIRRGLGRMLLTALRKDAHAEGFDLIGASFGATPDLLRFWERIGSRVVQIGTRRNAASGEHAAVVLEAVTPAGAHLIARAQKRLGARLPVLLAGPLRALDPTVVTALTCALPPSVHPCRDECDDPGPLIDPRELQGFAAGHRTLEASLPLLSELARTRLADGLAHGLIGPDDAALLVAATRQLRPLPELVGLFGASGQDALLTRLRSAAGRLLQEIRPTPAHPTYPDS